MASLIERIQEALGEQDLSPRAASLEAGLSPRFLSDLFVGAKRSLSIANASRLAAVLNRTPEYLAFGRGHKYPDEVPKGEEAELIHWLRSASEEKRKALREVQRALDAPQRTKADDP